MMIPRFSFRQSSHIVPAVRFLGVTSMKMLRPFSGLARVLLVASLTLSASGADLTLRVADKAPPKELDEAVSKLLQKQAVQLLAGDKPAFEFWLVSEVALTQKPAALAKALDALKQTTLLGVVSVPTAQRDYRDDEIAAGVYTMRLVIQPGDGNHLGSSEFTWFAALVPAKLDPKPDGISDYKALIKASSKQTSTDHPVILSLRPATSADGESPKLNVPAPEHKSVRIKMPAKAGGASTELLFEIVYEGKGHK